MVFIKAVTIFQRKHKVPRRIVLASRWRLWVWWKSDYFYRNCTHFRRSIVSAYRWQLWISQTSISFQIGDPQFPKSSMAQKMVRPIHILYQKTTAFGLARGGPRERPEDDPKPEGPQVSPNERGSKKGLPDKYVVQVYWHFTNLGWHSYS